VRDACYAVAFSSACDHLMDAIGLEEACRARTGCTLHTLELHLPYLAEVKQSETLVIRAPRRFGPHLSNRFRRFARRIGTLRRKNACPAPWA